jgi:hypothetical protein
MSQPKVRQRTGRLRAKETNGELVIAFRPFVAAYIRLIHRDGLHGLNIAHTADWLMCAAIRDEIHHNRAPLLMQDGAGGLKRMEHHTAAADADRLRWFATRTTTLTDTERSEMRAIAARLWFDGVQNEDAAEALGLSAELG